MGRIQPEGRRENGEWVFDSGVKRLSNCETLQHLWNRPPYNHPWITPFEKSGLTRTPRYKETIAWLGRLVEAAPELKMVSLGSGAERPGKAAEVRIPGPQRPGPGVHVRARQEGALQDPHKRANPRNTHYRGAAVNRF